MLYSCPQCGLLMAEDGYSPYSEDPIGPQTICYDCNFQQGVAASAAVQAAWRLGGYKQALLTYIHENLRKARK